MIKRTASVQEIITSSNRMHNEAMRSKERIQNKIKDKINPEDEQIKNKCTFKPNTNKSKFVKYPEPSTYRSKIDLRIKPLPKKQIDDKKITPKVSAKNQPSPRVEICYNWANKMKTINKTKFLSSQIKKSLDNDTGSRQREVKSKSQISIVLKRSLQRSTQKIAGTNTFFKRQEMARDMKSEKQFLLNNPTSHTWSFKKRVHSSLSTSSSHYLDFTESSYRKSNIKLL